MIVEEIVACGTVIVIGCFWLSAKVVQSVFEPDPPPPPPPATEEADDPVWPFQTPWDPCAICGQSTRALSRAAFDFLLQFTCPKCGAAYLTEPCKSPKEDPAPDTVVDGGPG